MGHEIGSPVTDEHYIDQEAQVKRAAIEFSKLAAEIKKIAGSETSA
jgi:hypothetical protein